MLILSSCRSQQPRKEAWAQVVPISPLSLGWQVFYGHKKPFAPPLAPKDSPTEKSMWRMDALQLSNQEAEFRFLPVPFDLHFSAQSFSLRSKNDPDNHLPT